jgi:chemotaxis protein methyltransferase CheR/type IV pilus assembly protein PilK
VVGASDTAKDRTEVQDGLRHRAGLDDQQFSEWREFLENRIGLFIAPERRSFLASGLRKRMREVGCVDYADYYRYMAETARRAEEWALLADCLTVHETCFFRHESSLKLVEEVALPDAFNATNNYRAWSVGCATGEEAYSLAMLLDDYLSARNKEAYFGVTGTDISLPSLRKARAGVYPNRRLQGVRNSYQTRYCRLISPSHFEIISELRKRVCFAQLNIKNLKEAPFARLDLIYCQNLLIYYGREKRKQIVNRLVEFLRPEGILVLGPGELVDWQHPQMEKVRFDDTLAYRRAG